MFRVINVVLVVVSKFQLVGSHFAAYEALYKQIDPAGVNQIGAIDAAAFLKRSALPDTVLRDIWELADPERKGFLDRYGFFVALKLIALAQSGVSPSTAALYQTETPAPRLQNTPPAIDWSIKAENRKKYEEMFQTLGPQNGLLPGNKVKPVMLNSKLPVEVLGQIWDMSDQDQDGSLDMEEFVVAMHLVSKALIENAPIPKALPPQLVKTRSAAIIPDLIPSGFDDPGQGSSPAPPVAPTLPATVASPPAADPSPGETVGNGDSIMEIEREKHLKLFKRLDADKDGFVNGADCKQTFLDTGLPQQDLAQIWGSVDTAQTGRLSSVQFVQAMGMVEEKLRERSKPTGNKELDALNEEIRQLQTEKRIIQEEVDVVEAEARTREAEVAAARRELEQLQAMLRQLEVQKREANKKLAELGVQKGALEQRLTETKAQLQDEQEKVAVLRKTFEDEKKAIEETMDQEDPKEKELSEQLKKIVEEIESSKATLQEWDDRKEAAIAKLAEEMSFASDPFAGQDPFAASGSDPFGSSATGAGGVDPFGGDPFASRASPTPALPPKTKGGTKAPPPRPAPPSRPAGPTRAAPPVPPPPLGDDPFAPSNPSSAQVQSNDGFANFDAFGASAF
ncbi:epidermal growth factor receptor substrate 15-like 1 [Galendromus occidentalis]|uniref:Epidermal growth factor receptor substrate 15-like 1 n=1 Tax=Galendromus occidentalis TaxID=34638 RepID=A0AAJ6QRW0_9ACAR|nr:epidermal growth factor receptor substrate 15-like 1 [Galendromus occidentalis]